MFSIEKPKEIHLESWKAIVTESLASHNLPTDQFNFDLSCNIAMVLGKKNKINPETLALKLKDIFLNKIKNFSKIEIAGPGFLNIKLSKSALLNNINSILDNKVYGSSNNN